MSELKATTIYDAYWKANSVGEGTGILVYLKSEADKVIAEKDEEIYNINYSRDEWAKACNQKDKEIAELQKTNSQLASSCVMLNKSLDTREEEVKTLKRKLEAVQASMYCRCGGCEYGEPQTERRTQMAKVPR